MCRQPITGLASVQEAVSTLAPKEAAKPAAEEEAAVPAGPLVPVGDTDGLVAAFKETAGVKCNSSLDAVVKSLELALQYKPKGLRVLLCCNVHGNSCTYNATLDKEKNTTKSRQFLRAEHEKEFNPSSAGRSHGLAACIPSLHLTSVVFESASLRTASPAYILHFHNLARSLTCVVLVSIPHLHHT